MGAIGVLDYDYTLLGFLLCTAGVLAAAWAWTAAAAALRRRARRERFRREERAHAVAAAPPEQPAGISPERAAGITRDAEVAAWRVARGGGPPVAANPHGPRTREFVLWEASFHSALSDYADLADLADVTDKA